MTETPKTTAGDLLKQGRLRQRLSIAECAKRTHVSARYLEALEEERWSDLPSESHRLGFLKLYAQFLGVSADEVLVLYRKGGQSVVSTSYPGMATPAPTPKPPASTKSWHPTSVGQVVALVLLFLVALWGLYHILKGNAYDSKTTSWVRLRPLNSTRLITSRPQNTIQKVRLMADVDSWIRVVDNRRLVYEGIFPAHATKEWTGAGPYLIKMGNTKAVRLYWNDQPVDVQVGAHAGMNELQLPLK